MAGRTIAIAGAGIGGLAAAALLARDGHRVRVFDQFDTPRPVGSGLVIQPVGQAVLAAAGAKSAMQLGQPIHRMLGHEAASGRVVLDAVYDPRGRGRFGLAIHRAALFQTLLGAARQAGAELVPRHRVVDAAHRRLTFADGASAGPFDLVVDATGARSILSPLHARPLPYGAIWGTVPWPKGTTLPSDQLTQRYRRADRMIGALPIGRLAAGGEDLAAIFWSLPRGAHEGWRSEPLSAWKDEAVALWPDFAPFLDPVEDHGSMTMARYAHGTLARPWRPGLVFIGDAAHCASPQLGQGANMALLDALALCLALRSFPVDDAGPAYARARRRHVRLYQLMSAAFTPQYQSDSRWLPMVRDRVLMPLSQVPPVPRVLSRLVCGDLVRPLGFLTPSP